LPREAHEIARFAASRGLVRELLGVIRDDDEERLGVPDRPGRRVVRRRRSLRIGLAARRRRRRRLERHWTRGRERGNDGLGGLGGNDGAGPVKGHAFGLDLTSNDRAALLAYVRSL
jgi:hypothetical protein